MSKKVIISGVTGQDGSYMADYLLEHTDCEIWGMMRRTSKPDLANLKGALKNSRFKTIIADLSDSQSIENIVNEIKPDYFINFAAQSFVGSSWQIPEQTFDVVAGGVLRILEAVRKHAPYCRVYSAGSSEEFGDVAYTPQDINHPIRPRSPYGAAKAAARHITKVWRESYNLYAIHSILFNHESERRGEEFVTRKITLGVSRIAKAVKEGGKIDPIELGNIDAKRDWSHATDFVRAVWLMLNQTETRFWKSNQEGRDLTPLNEEEKNFYLSLYPKEYVLSSGETHTVREFVEKAFKLAGISGSWVKGKTPQEEVFRFFYAMVKGSDGSYVKMESYTGPDLDLVRINPAFYRPADVELLLGDSTPARNELGWKPEVSFDQLVKRMIKSDLAAVGLEMNNIWN